MFMYLCTSSAEARGRTFGGRASDVYSVSMGFYDDGLPSPLTLDAGELLGVDGGADVTANARLDSSTYIQ